jgi:hypothetical protein
MRSYLARMSIALFVIGLGILLLPSAARADQPLFTATLSPTNETAAVMGDDTQITGTGSVLFTLTKDSGGNITAATAVLSFTVNNVPSGETITGAHVHPGAAGVAGGVIISSGVSGLMPISGTATFTSASITVSAANAQAIISNPAGFYFNVHTSANPGGAARGQLAAAGTVSTVELDAVLSPAAEVPPVTGSDTSITGSASAVFTLTKDSGGNITAASAVLSFVANNIPSGENITAAHIHTGAAGVSGGVLVSAGVPAPLIPTGGMVTFTSASVAVSPTNAQNIISNPAGFYFNIHSTANPGGAGRGQLEFPPIVSNVAVQGKNLQVTGTGFTAGAQILLNGAPVNVTKQPKNDTTTLIGKKAAKPIASGQTVLVQVQLADGLKGPGVNFTKP